jgi:hypothetical protein
MRGSFRKIPLLVLGVVLLLGGGAACRGGDHTAALPPTTSVSPVIRGALSQRDVDTVDLAQQLLIQACLKQRGFHYVPFGTGGTRPVDAAESPYQQSVAQARARGFGGSDTTSHLDAAEPPNENTRYVASLSSSERARYQQTLFGNPGDKIGRRLSDGTVLNTPRHGCLANAYEEIYGTLQSYLQYSGFSFDVLRTASTQTDKDPKYQAAQHTWIGCIRSKGYRATTPPELAQQALAPYAKRGTNKAAARRREITMAVAAAECDAAAHLTSSHDRAKQDSIDKLVKLNATAYTTFRNTAAAARARATAIVANQSTPAVSDKNGRPKADDAK